MGDHSSASADRGRRCDSKVRNLFWEFEDSSFQFQAMGYIKNAQSRVTLSILKDDVFRYLIEVFFDASSVEENVRKYRVDTKRNDCEEHCNCSNTRLNSCCLRVKFYCCLLDFLSYRVSESSKYDQPQDSGDRPEIT